MSSLDNTCLTPYQDAKDINNHQDFEKDSLGLALENDYTHT